MSTVETFGRLEGLLRAGEDVVVATVVGADGSSPRTQGARMLVTARGRVFGTVGGGAIEHRAELQAAETLRERSSCTRHFRLANSGGVDDVGMECGGAMDVLFQYVPAGDARTLALCEEIAARRSERAGLWLVTDVAQAHWGLYPARDHSCAADVPAEIAEGAAGGAMRTQAGGLDLLVEPVCAESRVFVFGCGHVAQELVALLQHLGFACVALDDRPEYANRGLFPTAEDVRTVDFTRIGDAADVRSHDAVCVMTRGHDHDAVVLAQLLRGEAAYIGAIGSRRKVATIQAWLRDQGFTSDDLARINSPIGVPIKTETPAEIAVSIAAELIQWRADRRGGGSGRRT